MHYLLHRISQRRFSIALLLFALFTFVLCVQIFVQLTPKGSQPSSSKDVELSHGQRIWLHDVSRADHKQTDLNAAITNGSQFYLHYIRFMPNNKNTTFRFLDYLAVKSALQFLKPDEILVHGDFEPTGPYWNSLKEQHLIRHLFRNRTVDAGKRMGKVKKVAFMEHSADISKLDVLLEYGGVVADFDVYFVRGDRIKQILTRKRSMVCYGDEDGNNIGLVAAHKDSKLIWAWRRSYNDIYVTDWNFNQAFLSKFLCALYHEEVYLVDHVCNNPHPDRNLRAFFHDYGKMNWSNSVAIHSYERFGGAPINSPGDLNGTLTSHKELLLTIYENRPLPKYDTNFQDQVNPLLL